VRAILLIIGLALLGFVVGGSVGYWVMLPPTPAEGEYLCGLAVLPAALIGLPIGAFIGMMIGILVGVFAHQFQS
jgi:hypothetical protein